jgi:hypothetical protein
VDAARKEGTPEQAPVGLIILTAIVYVAGFAMVIAWFALVLLGQPAPNIGPRSAAPMCNVCGVVERVGEFERTGFALIGEQNEGFVVLLAKLGGVKSDVVPMRVYETAVVHDDGSVRVVRDTSMPQWKQGDRVKVVRGRVEPLALGHADKF